MAYMKLNFESQFLNGNTEVGIILPDRNGRCIKTFYNKNKRFKVLWLLHGTTGDYSDWIRWSMIEIYACEHDLAVIMPSTQNASYTNWKGFGGGYYVYDYFFKELMPMIYNWFPVSDKREDNFVAGLSMGGLGALKFALTNPDRFAAAAVLSACPHDYEWELNTGNGATNQRYTNLFQNAGGYDMFLNSDDNIWKLCNEYVGKKSLPRLYFSEGDKDEYFGFFQHFAEHAKKSGFEIKVEIIHGYAHEWRLWNRTIQRALEFFGFPRAGRR
ncbi:alpha/beta hydrolase [Hungatella hathewayi]